MSSGAQRLPLKRARTFAGAAIAVLSVALLAATAISCARSGDAGSTAGENVFGEPGGADAGATAGLIATQQNLKVAFIGDTAKGSNFQAVLGLIQAEGADLVLHQGDFDYADDPDGFFPVIDGVLGPAFPYLASVGNHDIGSWPVGCGDPDGCYATFFKQRMAATGIVPDDANLDDDMYSTQFGGLQVAFTGQTTSAAGDCPSNPSGYACFIRNQLQADNHIWRICSWHKNQSAMQVGSKTDEAGWDVYNTCIEMGAIIATAHEHSYSRTKTLTDAETQTVDLVQHPLVSGVPSNPNSLRVSPGASFVFVSGLGGNSMRNQVRCLPAAYPYGCNREWASIYTLDQTGNQSRYGALFIEFYVDGDPFKARGYFKTTGGIVVDSFEITTGFGDADADGLQDNADNCPAWSNPAQQAPDWPVPAGDADCDGWPDGAGLTLQAAETTLTTDPARHCAMTRQRNDEAGADAWPMDFDDSQLVNGQDFLLYNPRFGARSGDPQYSQRFDLNANGIINAQDMLHFNTFFSKACSP